MQSMTDPCVKSTVWRLQRCVNSKGWLRLVRTRGSRHAGQAAPPPRNMHYPNGQQRCREKYQIVLCWETQLEALRHQERCQEQWHTIQHSWDGKSQQSEAGRIYAISSRTNPASRRRCAKYISSTANAVVWRSAGQLQKHTKILNAKRRS